MKFVAQIDQISALEVGKELNMVLQVHPEVEALLICSLIQWQLQYFSDTMLPLELHLLELHQFICLFLVGQQLGQLWIMHRLITIFPLAWEGISIQRRRFLGDY